MKIFLGSTALLSCELKLRVRGVHVNNKTYRQNITIFSITERKILAYRYFFSMSDEESHSSRKRMLKITFGVFYCILFKNSANCAIVRSVITGKSQTLAVMYRSVNTSRPQSEISL